MWIEILIGAAIGVCFGIIQMLVLKKVVKAVTEATQANGMTMVIALLQFFAFVVVLVLLGRYSLIAVAAAGATMAVAASVTWAVMSARRVKEGQ